jgi:DNA-binding response OmpR family regulator
MDEMNAPQKRILVVDDDPDMRLSLRLPLEAAGYEVIEANGPADARLLIRDCRPQLVILDVMMDTTTAGFQFALELHSADPRSEFKEFSQVPIIMLTAIHSTTPLRFAPDQDYLPVQTFLEKPLDADVLLAKVRALLGE